MVQLLSETMTLFAAVGYLLLSTVVCFRVSSATEDGVINFRIAENEPQGAFVGIIAQHLRTLENVSSNIRENAQFTFLNPNSANNIYFVLDSSSGSLTTSAVKIDRESVCPYKVECSLEVSVAVKSVEGFFDVPTVVIEVLDVNDNRPTFPRSMIVLNISESVPVGKEFTIENAEDADMWGNNSIQSYELIQNVDVFKLDVFKYRDGSYNLKLVLEQLLDRETMDFYSLTVVAKDGGDPIKEGVLNIKVNIVDANDNSPIFEKDYYNVTVKESINPGTVILELSASDADDGKNKEISYRFSERQSDIDVIRRLFYINENSGELSVVHDLHSEQSESFEFFVEAFDHGDQSRVNQTVVLVRIEDAGNNAPVVTLHLLASDNIGFVNLSESEKVGAFVAHINVEDTDTGENGNVSCRTESDYFGIEKLLVRGYKIVTVKSLDRETLPLHEITVTCFDNGVPSLSSSVSFLVSIEDANDNAPKFGKDSYHVSVHENNDLLDVITEVSATDMDIGNNKIFEYFLHPEDINGFFSINNDTGIIYALDTLDREKHPLIVFRVIAVDHGNPQMTGTTTVSLTLLDQNDNIPHIVPARPKLTIMENMPKNTSLGFLTGSDDDEGINSKFTFSIAPVSATFPFELTPSGEFRTKKKLDRELQNRYEIPVTVSDLALKPLSNTQYVTITVTDDNDNDPIITFPNSDNDSVDFVYPVSGFYNVVTSIAAYDVDDGENGTLTYSIIEGNQLGIFEIDSEIGEISVTKFIDIEKDVRIPLLIKVQDKGVEPKYATALLTVNLIYANATKVPSAEAGSNKYIIISVLVVVATVLLAVAIVGVILFLRSLDRNKGGDGENGSAGYSDSGISSHSDSQSLPQETDNGTGDTKKRKKEVSFSLGFSLEGLDVGRNAETSTDSDPLNNVSTVLYIALYDTISIKKCLFIYLFIYVFSYSFFYICCGGKTSKTSIWIPLYQE